jgi:hypothetical protein
LRHPRDIHIDLSNAHAPKRATMTPQERAVRDAAQMGSRAAHELENYAVIPAFITFAVLLYLIYQVAQNAEQLAIGALIAAFITALIWRLPVNALRMQRAYPQTAKWVRIFWGILVAVAVIAVAVYFMGERGGLNVGLVMLALCVICIPLAGLIPEWAVMSAGDVGEPVVASVPSAVAQPVETGGNSQEDVFGMWAAGRLMPSSSDKVSSTVALGDYRETCDLNGVQPMTDAKFFAALKQLALLSNGAVSSSKIGGTMHYHGWSLPTQLQAIENAPMERITGPR